MLLLFALLSICYAQTVVCQTARNRYRELFYFNCFIFDFKFLFRPNRHLQSWRSQPIPGPRTSHSHRHHCSLVNSWFWTNYSINFGAFSSNTADGSRPNYRKPYNGRREVISKVSEKGMTAWWCIHIFFVLQRNGKRQYAVRRRNGQFEVKRIGSSVCIFFKNNIQYNAQDIQQIGRASRMDQRKQRLPTADRLSKKARWQLAHPGQGSSSKSDTMWYFSLSWKAYGMCPQMGKGWDPVLEECVDDFSA